MGTIKRVRKVEAKRPPIKAMAMGDRISDPSEVEIAMGSIPIMVDNAVMIMGLIRVTAPLTTASNLSVPLLINWLI